MEKLFSPSPGLAQGHTKLTLEDRLVQKSQASPPDPQLSWKVEKSGGCGAGTTSATTHRWGLYMGCASSERDRSMSNRQGLPQPRCWLGFLQAI